MQKIFGFVFFLAGVGLIFFALYSGYETFSGKSAPPNLFSAPSQSASLNKIPSSLNSPEALQNQLQNALNSPLATFIPSNTIPTILNLAAWSIFLGLLMLGGGQIAGIGIKLLK